jgi:DNA polymerase theta
MAIHDYIQKTLLHFSMNHDELNVLVKTTLDKLAITGLIRIDSGSDFEPTLLGQAIVASSLTPEDGIFVHRQLQKAAKAFVLDGEMHVLYTFTPIQPARAEINWRIFRQEIECLDESGLRVLSLVGIKQASVNKLCVTPSVDLIDAH